VGHWVRKSEAAALFGVSERTIDNRVAAGKLQKRRHPYGVTEIFIDDEVAAGASERFQGAQRRANQPQEQRG
jgi:predicted nucleotidyltransferase